MSYYNSAYTGAEIDTAIGNALHLGEVLESTSYPGCYYRIVDGETEWINPPMVPGVAYRTAERYSGRPVYMFIANIGSLPNASSKTVNYGELFMEYVVSIQGVAYSIDTYQGKIYNDYLYLSQVASITVARRTNMFHLVTKTSSDYSTFNGLIIVKYVKDGE